MIELVREIIRQQWPLRHDADLSRNARARALIHAHVQLLRTWRSAACNSREFRLHSLPSRFENERTESTGTQLASRRSA